jgi:hypothetical protein
MRLRAVIARRTMFAQPSRLWALAVNRNASTSGSWAVVRPLKSVTPGIDECTSRASHHRREFRHLGRAASLPKVVDATEAVWSSRLRRVARTSSTHCGIIVIPLFGGAHWRWRTCWSEISTKTF